MPEGKYNVGLGSKEKNKISEMSTIDKLSKDISCGFLIGLYSYYQLLPRGAREDTACFCCIR